jgi:hypothetical protein
MMSMPNTNEPKALSPKDLADQLFDATLSQAKGDFREAAGQVILFLKEALVYAVLASAGSDEAARRGLIKSVGESIVAMSIPSPAASPR